MCSSASPSGSTGRVRRLAEVIAHRGASGDAPENTLAAFDLALEQGADALELDVRPTADGALVTVHDPTLLRTLGDERAVEEVTCEELEQLDHPAGPATLDAVLERYSSSTRYVVDLKDPRPAWESRVVEAIERHGVGDRVVVQSFDRDALVRLHAAAPDLAYTSLYRRAESADIDIDAVPPFTAAIGPWHVRVDADLVDRAHARGLAVHPWTVDEPAEAERLLALGVSGLITNRPDVVRAVTR